MEFKFNGPIISNIHAVKLTNNIQILVKTDNNNWFIIQRNGERSWEAVCVAGSEEYDYKDEHTNTLRGNGKMLLPAVQSEYGIKEAYKIYNKRMYRLGMVAILSTGDINSTINVEKLK